MSNTYYQTIVEHDDSTLVYLIDEAERFALPNVLEAVSLKAMSEYEVRRYTLDIRQRKTLMNKESLALAKFSEQFNRMYATDNNKCFELGERLFGKLRSTISGYKSVVRKFCPRVSRRHGQTFVRPSSFASTVIFNRQWCGDLFPDTYIDPVKELYYEMTDFFALATVTLALCHRVIMDEDKIRNNFYILKSIYEESCSDLRETGRLIAKAYTNAKQLPESELQKRRQNATSLQAFIKENFHKFNRSQLAEFVVLEDIREGNSHGMTPDETELWGNDYQKALEVREVVGRWDSLNISYTKTKTVGKSGKYETLDLVRFLKWGGVPVKKEKKLYYYLKANYKGSFEFPTWQAVSACRKTICRGEEDGKTLAQEFARKLEIRKENVSPMAITPAIQPSFS